MPDEDDPGAPEGPMAMQLVLRVERNDPPTASLACATVASAVAHLLVDERSTGEGDWAQAVGAWAPRPRKVVRRARGIAWRRCLELDGLTVERDGVEVRVLPPCPTGALVPEVAKLQVGGTDLDDPDRRRDVAVDESWPGVLLAVTPLVEMTAGKSAAQCGHAAQLSLDQMNTARRDEWAGSGFRVEVRFPTVTSWREVQALATVEVRDAGHTEIPPGTPTVLAIWR